MRILIYGINYVPELTGIGKYTGEMAEWLATRGHEVRVITAPPYYPMWRIGEGYSGWHYWWEERNGIAVYRCPIWVPRYPSGMQRILHHLSFAISSLPVVLWLELFWRPDVVWVVAPSLLSAPGAWLAARLGGARAWLHIQDFEMEAAFGLGLLPAGRIRKVATTLERWLIRRFDRISAISERMLEHLLLKGVDSSRCVLFPNWVDTEAIHPLDGPSPMRLEFHIIPDTFVALYSGNMGQKQGLEILVEAARSLRDYPKIQFTLCGDGAARGRLQKLAEGLPNICFKPPQPTERLNELLNLADIHLLPQRADVADLVMPSKLTGILASGRPVVATANPGTQVAKVVDGCGIVVPPGDGAALGEAVIHLARSPEERAQLGKAARSFAVANWDRDEVLRRFEKALSALSGVQL